MLQVAGQAALLDNAPPDLKLLAAQHNWLPAPDHNHDAVAHILEQFL
jgi:hypothetical protein